MCAKETWLQDLMNKVGEVFSAEQMAEQFKVLFCSGGLACMEHLETGDLTYYDYAKAPDGVLYFWSF